MKKNEQKALLTKSDSELQKLDSDLSLDIEKALVKRHTEQQKNTRVLRATRVKRAVINTILRQRQLGGTI